MMVGTLRPVAAEGAHAPRRCGRPRRTHLCTNRRLVKIVGRGGSAAVTVSAGSNMAGTSALELHAVDIDRENFAPFGQVISPQSDGEHFGETDAKLVLDQGVPRFYIMRLEKRGLSFGTIVHHAKVTQCLGSTQGYAWYMAVASSSVTTPSMENMRAFRIPPGVFIKLHCGTWHAGPLFDTPQDMDFANLELSDTNVTDFNCFDFGESIAIRP
mmetsp:Transcript_10027/g.30541  ORF Transcript_10027/g.30541 Transcript_10027/m.30541 type:complete len:213 (-) Transcript_10027:1268-1906(-)